MQDGPWWFAPIVGVIVGVGVKWIIDLITESSRRKREDRLRFLQDKREAYARLLAAGRRARLYNTRVLRGTGPAKEATEARSQARDDAGDAFAEIMVIGSRQAVDAARAYFNLLVKTGADDDAVKRSRSTFRMAARIDLGTDPPKVLVLRRRLSSIAPRGSSPRLRRPVRRAEPQA